MEVTPGAPSYDPDVDKVEVRLMARQMRIIHSSRIFINIRSIYDICNCMYVCARMCIGICVCACPRPKRSRCRPVQTKLTRPEILFTMLILKPARRNSPFTSNRAGPLFGDIIGRVNHARADPCVAKSLFPRVGIQKDEQRLEFNANFLNYQSKSSMEVKKKNKA